MSCFETTCFDTTRNIMLFKVHKKVIGQVNITYHSGFFPLKVDIILPYFVRGTILSFLAKNQNLG